MSPKLSVSISPPENLLNAHVIVQRRRQSCLDARSYASLPLRSVSQVKLSVLIHHRQGKKRHIKSGNVQSKFTFYPQNVIITSQ